MYIYVVKITTTINEGGIKIPADVKNAISVLKNTK